MKQAELLGATRAGDGGHYLTVHILAQASDVPAQRRPVTFEDSPALASVPKQRGLLRRVFDRSEVESG